MKTTKSDSFLRLILKIIQKQFDIIWLQGEETKVTKNLSDVANSG